MVSSVFDKKFLTPRDIPQVEQAAGDPAFADFVRMCSRSFVVQEIQRAFDGCRRRLSEGLEIEGGMLRDDILASLKLSGRTFSTRVINCTGIVVHTNLGRAPLGQGLVEIVARRLTGYTNLEYDLVSGKRGRRGEHASRLLTLLTGARSACVVNNNAAAVFLILNTLCKGKECVVSRGELVQIGGGFRMPDVMEASGAILREVGASNRVSFDDYFRALGSNTGMIVKVHLSNFSVHGFTEFVEAKLLAELGKERSVPVMYDLGSGVWLSPSEFGLQDELSIDDALRSGADLVCFSGDKLLGGPQAGIILGDTEWIKALHANPMYRAMRPDKMTLMFLEETILSYLRGLAETDLPVVRLLKRSVGSLRDRAERMSKALNSAGVEADTISLSALAGGGSAPGENLPSHGVRLPTTIAPDDIAARLRLGEPPVIGRVVDDRFVLDLKAVFEHEDELVVKAVLAAYN
jgi:L-seryl-tRNA(Ser) seleniumtransferase